MAKKLSKAARERFIVTMADPITANELADRLDELVEEENRESSFPVPEKVLYRAYYGDDTTGNGTIEQPYKTWKKCLDQISDASGVKIYGITSLTTDASAEPTDIVLKPWVVYSGPDRDNCGMYREDDREITGTANGNYFFSSITFYSGLNISLTTGATIRSHRLRVLGRTGASVIAPVADVAGSLAGKYFKVNGAFSSFYFWFRVNGVGSDPAVVGSFGVPVDILENSTPTMIATAINDLLTGSQGWLLAMNQLGASISAGKETHRVWANRLPSHYDIAGPARYFTFSHPTGGKFYIWFKVTDGQNTQADPAVAGATGLQVNLSMSDDPNLGHIADKIVAAANGVPGALFQASRLGGDVIIVDIQNSVTGDVEDCHPGTSGMSVYVVTQGVSANQFVINQFQGGEAPAPDMGTSGFTLVSHVYGAGCKIQTTTGQLQLDMTDFSVPAVAGLYLKRCGGTASRDWILYHAFFETGFLQVDRASFTGFGQRDGSVIIRNAVLGAGVPGFWAIGSGGGSLSSTPGAYNQPNPSYITANLTTGSNVLIPTTSFPFRNTEGTPVEGPGIPANTTVINSTSLDRRKLCDSSGSNVLTGIDDTSDIYAGYSLKGTGIANGVTVTSVIDANSVQVSANIAAATGREVLFISNRMLMSNNATVTRNGVELITHRRHTGLGALPNRVVFTDHSGFAHMPMPLKNAADVRTPITRLKQLLDILASRKQEFEVLPAIVADDITNGYVRSTKRFKLASIQVQRRNGGLTGTPITAFQGIDFTVSEYTDPTTGSKVSQISFDAGSVWHSAGGNPLSVGDVLIVHGETESEIF
jgi:hypothetical protein